MAIYKNSGNRNKRTFYIPETRARSGNREGDYASSLMDSPTRERSGVREHDYAPFLAADPLVKTRERSGKREGDYATFLTNLPEKKDLLKAPQDGDSHPKLTNLPNESNQSSTETTTFHFRP